MDVLHVSKNAVFGAGEPLSISFLESFNLDMERLEMLQFVINSHSANHMKPQILNPPIFHPSQSKKTDIVQQETPAATPSPLCFNTKLQPSRNVSGF